MSSESFDYGRSSRYHIRTIKSLCDTIQGLVTKEATFEIVSEVRVTVEELVTEYEQFKQCTSRGFAAIDPKKKAEEIKQLEDDIFNDVDTVKKVVLPTISKGKSYIGEFETERSCNSLIHNQGSHTNGGAELNVKLPRIEIPTFDGSIENYLEFAALFQNVVHDEPSLSKAKKLYYLKKSLVGEAESLLKDVQITDKGYDDAWSLVQSTYRDIKSITRKHFDNLFSLSRIKSAAEIPSLLVKVRRTLKGLKACNLQPEDWSHVVAYWVSEKLDEATYVEFEKSLNSNTSFPVWEELQPFLEMRASVSKRQLEPNQSSASVKPQPNPKRNHRAVLATTTNSNSKPQCLCCSQFHLLIECDDFKSKTPKERFEVLRAKNVCKNCFLTNHSTKECKKEPSCRRCRQHHHTLLHFEDKRTKASVDVSESNKSEIAESNNQNKSAMCVSASVSSVVESKSSLVTASEPTVLLPTAVVKFRCGDKIGEMRVLLDSCSQVNLITSEFVKRHNLSTNKIEYSRKVTGIASESRCDRVANLTIESKVESFAMDASLTVIDNKIPYSLSDLFTGNLSSKLADYKLADPAFRKSTVNIPPIDALLGIECYDRCVRGEKLQIGSICLRSTTLGWTLSSALYPTPSQRSPKPSNAYCGLTVHQVDERLKKFWEIEDIQPTNLKSAEHEDCNQHFEDTHQIGPDGRFIVRLPYKDDPNKIANNYKRALNHLRRNERRLKGSVAKMYDAFMEEYKDLKHMTLVTDRESRYFIPHLAVLRPLSTTTQFRAVFNASSPSYSGLSLNDILMNGPSLQPDLIDILLALCLCEYIVTGDIEKMYRCIWVHPDDRRFQSILWKLLIYELNTLTYGTGPASFIATKCLAKLAEMHEKTYPEAAKIIRECFYMDDLMMGANSIAELIQLRKDVHRILASAGFNLRKYQSNSTEILETIESNLIEKNLTVSFGGNESLSILGLTWVPTLDVFQLKSNLDVPIGKITKRQMLSTISKTFDPLGYAAPVVIRGKIMFQRLWKLGLGWDDVVPEELAHEFKAYVGDLINLHQFCKPRFVGNHQPRIIGFSDASEQAYCAVVYILTNKNNEKRSELYISKTRVAPVKSLTIPQLELQAAVLLSDLVDRVRKHVKVELDHINLYSDSTIVLSWLARPASDWKTFVRNRIAKISAAYPASCWSHVSSKSNPADLATRGMCTSELIESKLWINGPSFIVEDHKTDSCFEIDHRCEEYRSKPKSAVLIVSETVSDLEWIESFSSYQSLLRVRATVIACCRKWRTKPKAKTGAVVQVNDLIAAEQSLIKITQMNLFADEYQRLKSNRKLCKRSRLRSHNPFIDEAGVLRSRSRLQNARAPFNTKCPIILPTKCHLTGIFIRYLHERYFHANRAFLLAHLSSRFVFVGGISRLIKSVTHQCVPCKRYFYLTKPQQMADLPADRVNPKSPFEVVGVDFTGAFTVKCNYHRAIKYTKAYAAIFVCFSTRAVHIELVTSLSTEDFLNALKCFVSRRGLPSTIYSDNGTNFRGADRYLNLQSDEIVKFAQERSIKWKFNPPYTPHRGGIWESAVKSAKRFLPIVTQDQTLTYNELRVLLTQIECLLNSRPLAYEKSEEPIEEVLTPGHFLIGRNLTVVPEPSEPKPTKLSAQYRANSQRIRDFWRLWAQDYLNQLRRRTKWADQQPNLKIGQVVLLKDSLTTPGHWKMGKINRTLADGNGVVRTVEVTTNEGAKIVPTIHAVPL